MSEKLLSLRIRWKLFFYILLFSSLPIIILLVFLYNNILNYEIEQAKNNSILLLQDIENYIDYKISNYEKTINEIFTNNIYLEIINKKVNNNIEEMINNQNIKKLLKNIIGDFCLIDFTDKSKIFVKNYKIYYSFDKNFIIDVNELIKDPLYLSLLENKKKIVYGKFKNDVIISNENEKDQFIFLLYPLYNKDKVEKLIIVLFNFDFFSNYKNKNFNKSFFYILDELNNIIFGCMDKNNFNILKDSPDIHFFLDKIENSKEKEMKFDYAGVISINSKNYLSIYRFNYKYNFKLIYLVEMSQIYKRCNNLSIIIISFSTILIIIIIIINLFFSKKFSYPIERKSNALLEENFLFMSLAHETKTPLTLIINYLKKYIQNHTITEELLIIKENIEKLLNDMLNFLDLGKLERGNIIYDNNQIINISDFLNKKILIYKESASIKNIKINYYIEDNIYTKIDPLALERIFNNLIDNAIKFNKQNGLIDINLSLNKNNIIIIISDTGIGINNNKIKYLFKPYSQIINKEKIGSGFGIGLYITKKIIESIKGHIEVTGKENIGTKFKIILKNYKLKQNDKISTLYDFKYNILNTNFNTKKILYDEQKDNIFIIEDNEQLRNFLIFELNDLYNIYYANNGEEALIKLENIKKPDVIISDIIMDQMNGYELYKKLSENSKYNDIPFIFISALSSMDEKLKAIETGAIDFIQKPFIINELIAKINSIIRFNKLKKSLYEKEKFTNLGMLLGGISHEILNPLFNIYAPVENIKKILIDSNFYKIDKILYYFDNISLNLSRIENIIKSLKILYYNKEFEKEYLNISDIIDSILDLLKNKLGEKSIIINKYIDNDFIIYSNKIVITQILLNLISNSIDAIINSGLIQILCKKNEDRKTISIIDNGCGIDEKDIPNIFNAFWTTKEIGKSSGLGLFIVKDLVLKMGWDIKVFSEKNKETEFRIYLY